MVYGGKPSRGCRTCRARRIKCDEGKPTCRRCEKSRRECGGYRPEFEIVHRDQTNSTVRRLRKTTDHHHHHQQDPTRHGRLIFVQEEPQPWRRSQSSSPSPDASLLTVPLAHRASCYFASNFILVPLDAAPHGFMEYLVPLMDLKPPGDALRHAFNACAFALLGNRARADGVDVAQLSLKEHTLALAQTHKALGSPTLASTDSTLAAVLLLILYESITALKEGRMLAWRSHIDGAVRIVKARGREEMCRTRIGTLLFTAVRHHLVSRVLSSNHPLPLGADWWMSGGDTDSLFAQCQRFALAYSELRNDVDRLLTGGPKSPESIAEVREVAKRVQRLDQDIARWQRSIPDEFRFKTVGWVSEDDAGAGSGLPKGKGTTTTYAEADVFPGRVDVYPDFVTAMAWNISRVVRLILASVNIRLAAWVCAPGDYRAAPEYETSKRICEVTIAAVIASVPYHLGGKMSGRAGALSSNPGLSRSAFACGEEGACKALPGLFLIWSLTCVKNHDITTEEQRAWAKGRLKFIAEDVGLKYAHIVNEVEIRFPSMMIARDGMMVQLDPLRPGGLEVAMRRRANVPNTPESMASATTCPSPPSGD